MKLKIREKLKRILIIFLSIVICISILLIFKMVKYPEIQQEKVSLYTYNNKAEIKYDVVLKPNILYENEYINKGNIFITEFIDYIQTDFNYEFSGSEKAKINGNYEIIGQVEGYVHDGEITKTIWEKKFSLLPKTNFDVNEKEISINKTLPIEFNKFNLFANEVLEASKINSLVKLNVFMNVSLNAETKDGLIEEEIVPLMVIPLNTSYFEIMGNLKVEKPGAIESVKEIKVPVNKKNIVIYSIITMLILISLIYVVFFTTTYTISYANKYIKKILKIHSERLVAVRSDIFEEFEKYYEVNSLDDLIKISDELEKPIMYKNNNMISNFYVIDNQTVYFWDIKKHINNIEKGIKDKNSNDVKSIKIFNDYKSDNQNEQEQ